MPVYNLTEYSDNYSKASGSLWQFYKDKPFIGNKGNIIDDPYDPNTASFKYKLKNNMSNRKLCNKRCSNNGTIKIFK